MLTNDQEFQQNLAQLEKEEQRQQKELNDINLKILSLKKRISTQIQPQNGYVVCLDFGSGIRSCEWSEDVYSWRVKGLGTRYSSLKEAEQRFAMLKKKWPNYPLKIKN